MAFRFLRGFSFQRSSYPSYLNLGFFFFLARILSKRQPFSQLISQPVDLNICKW